MNRSGDKYGKAAAWMNDIGMVSSVHGDGYNIPLYPLSAIAPNLDRNMDGAEQFVEALITGASIWPNKWGQDVALAAFTVERLKNATPVSHTDHPARHYDRTCPACVSEIARTCPKCGETKPCGFQGCHMESALSAETGSTPRTDAAVEKPTFEAYGRLADFARQLERELAVERAARAENYRMAVAAQSATVPLEPTKEMIEEGAQRLVSWEDGCKWPDSWDGLRVAATRQEADRVWRSMYLAATESRADSSPDR